MSLAALAIAVAVASPIFLGIGWVVWDSLVRPLLIPRPEIKALADEYVVKYGSRAEEMARISEDRAWRYGEGREQGKWRRVRHTIHESERR